MHSLDPGDDGVVSDTDVFIHVDRVRLLAELRVVVVVVQYIHVDSCAEEQNRDIIVVSSFANWSAYF